MRRGGARLLLLAVGIFFVVSCNGNSSVDTKASDDTCISDIDRISCNPDRSRLYFCDKCDDTWFCNGSSGNWGSSDVPCDCIDASGVRDTATPGCAPYY